MTIPKPKKINTQAKKRRLQKKADRLYQEIGRLTYKYCELCSTKMSCLHHFFPKSTSSALRYNIKNGIPVCNKCHCRIHSSDDPTIIARILNHRGDEWFEELLSIKKNTFVKTSLEYYKTIITNLEKIMPYKPE